MFLFGLFEWLSGQWDKGNPHEQLASVAIISSVLLIVLPWGMRKICRWRYRVNLFRLGYPPYWPAPSNVVYTQTKTVRQGKSDILIAVVVGSFHAIKDFDIRFVQTKKGGNVDGSTIRVVGVRDTDMNLPFERPDKVIREGQVFLWGMPNAANGMDCHYFQPVPIHAHRALFLTVSIEALQPWRGYLGFRGLDKYGKQVKPKASFMVEATAPTPDKEGSQSE